MLGWRIEMGNKLSALVNWGETMGLMYEAQPEKERLFGGAGA